MRTEGKKIERLYRMSPAYAAAPAANYESAPTYEQTLEEQVLNLLMTGTMEPTFYVDAQELVNTAIGRFRACAGEQPEFLAKAAVYARNEGFMRLSPITALTVLSTAHDKSLFHKAFPKIIRTPGDLQDFVSIILAGGVRGMGRTVKRAVNTWLANMSEFHALKYGSEAQAISLRDIYRLTKPKGFQGQAQAIARYIVKEELDASILPTIAQVERLKKGLPLAESLDIINEAHLPWEIATSLLPRSKELWASLASYIPYMALLRNLNNFAKYGVLDDEGKAANICRRLSDPLLVRQSKQFPFRFLTASLAFGDKHTGVSRALEAAFELAVDNVPPFGDRVMVAVDNSGSMSSRISERSEVTAAMAAGSLAAIAIKRAGTPLVFTFDSDAHQQPVDRRQAALQMAYQLGQHAGGGTNLSAPLKALLDSGMLIDTALFITDSESWVDHLRGWGALDIIRSYKSRYNPHLRCFFIQVVPYPHRAVPPDEPGCWYIYGWSDSILKFLAEPGGQVERVRGTALFTEPQIERQALDKKPWR